MSRRFGITVTAAASVVALTLAGCSSSGGSKSDGTAQSTSPVSASSGTDTSLASLLPSSIKSAGSVSVATPGNTPPEEFADSSGALQGYEIDLVKAVTAQLGLKPDFKVTQFASIIPGMQAKRYDLAIGQIGINVDREKAVDMVSIAALTEAFGVIKSSGITSLTLATLCGHSISTLTGAEEQQEAAEQSKKCTSSGEKPITVRTYPDAGSAWLAVQSGRVQVYWVGSTAVGYAVAKSTVPAAVVGINLAPTPTAILVQKGSGMAPAIQNAVQAIIDSGQYATIMKKWGVSGDGIKTSQLNPAIATP